MNRALILAGLYNAARPQGMGFLQYKPQPMTEQQAESELQKSNSFDYLYGRVLKIRITETGVDSTHLYNRDNGEQAAELVLASLEATGDPNNIIIQKLHQGGLQEAAEMARQLAKTNTAMNTSGNVAVVILGADSLGEELNEAINQATI